MKYVRSKHRVSDMFKIIEIRKCQEEGNYDKVGELININLLQNVNLDMKREIAFHRDTGDSISDVVCLYLYKDLVKFSLLYDVDYIKNLALTLRRRHILARREIETTAWGYAYICLTTPSVKEYFFVAKHNLPVGSLDLMGFGSIQHLEIREEFIKMEMEMYGDE